jgi:hypothetical protein
MKVFICPLFVAECAAGNVQMFLYFPDKKKK